MSTQFDTTTFNQPVFKQILGIDEDHQLETWYDLLGVPTFEADESSLDKAMVLRFQQVRRYQVGNYEQQALELIDELSRAYACLTSDETRRAYDETIRNPATSTTESLSVKKAPTDKPLKRAKRLVEDPVAADPNVCPKCGKPTSPKAPACYQCGYKKATSLESRGTASRGAYAAETNAMRELVQQDLTPEQLLGRLRETRRLIAAGKRAVGVWKPPKDLMHMSGREPRSRCHRCGRGLMQQTEAHGIAQDDVRKTLEFIQTFAQQLQSLGKAQFDWPLSAADVRRVDALVPEASGNPTILYCHGCALRVLRSPRVGSATDCR